MYSEKDSLVVMAIPLEIRVEKHKEFNIKTHTAFVDFERHLTESREENY
jgi:hypothetical protein